MIVDVGITYYDFNGDIQTGILQVHKDIVEATKRVFHKLFNLKFPIYKVSPSFNRPDRDIILDNHTTGYNYRKVDGKDILSNHAYGRAIDINPKNNPAKPSSMPEVYDESIEIGKITPEIVEVFKSEGFQWGGEIFGDFYDAHHFQIEQ